MKGRETALALLHMQYRSEVLGINTSMDIVLPERVCPHADGKWPVLYLLHGLHGDHTAWQRSTSIERYVNDLDIAVVMPTVHNGFYTDMKHGGRYWAFISEEVPAMCERMFPIATTREKRYAAGLSMGGYGVFKLGLRCPERFAAVASLSGVVDMLGYARTTDQDEGQVRFFTDIFGTPEEMDGSDDDLPAVARRLIASGAALPRFYMACGTEDYLYANNQGFLRTFGEALSIAYEEGPGGHTWAFWDAYIQRVLLWMFGQAK